jgi:hypothetical protein
MIAERLAPFWLVDKSMDRIQAMQIFVRVTESVSFIHMAQKLSLPASTVTSSVKNYKNICRCACLIRLLDYQLASIARWNARTVTIF